MDNSQDIKIYSKTESAALLPLTELITTLKSKYASRHPEEPAINPANGNLYAVYNQQEIKCFLDILAVNYIKTAALSMLAVSQLMQHEPIHVALFGTGIQAQAHIEALLQLYPNITIDIIASSPSKALKFVQDYQDRRVRCTRIVFPEVDLVITASTSKRPVYSLHADTSRLVISIGAINPAYAEIGRNTIKNSTIYVDDISLAKDIAQDLIKAEIDWGQVLPLASAFDQISPKPIIFKPVGSLITDLAIQEMVLKNS